MLCPVSYTHLIDLLVADKQKDFANCGDGTMTDDVIRLREEISMQIKALKDMKIMAESYGYDISEPASNAKEAVQWTYFGYLAAIKTQNGAAMSIGRIATFLDIYIKRDMDKGILTAVSYTHLLLISPPFSPPKSIAFIPSGAKTQKIKRIDDNKCNVRASKNAEQAFSTQRYLYICYRLFFLFSSVFPK